MFRLILKKVVFLWTVCKLLVSAVNNLCYVAITHIFMYKSDLQQVLL